VDPIPNDPRYVAAWRRYRRWRTLSWIAFLGWMPYGVTVNTTADTYQLGKAWHVAVTLPWMIFIVVAGIKHAWFSCPRCGKRFFNGKWGRNPFAMDCRSCGLPKWALRDPHQPAPTQPEK
jgi:hypothetical protein